MSRIHVKVASALLLGTLLSCSAQAQYTFTTLDVPGFQGHTYGIGINKTGLIAGHVFITLSNGYEIYKYDPSTGQGSSFAVPGASTTVAGGINDNNEVSIWFVASQNDYGGVVEPNGSYSYFSLTNPSNIVAMVGGITNNVNGSYQITGTTGGTTLPGNSGFIRNSNGTYSTFTIPNGSTTQSSTYSVGINSGGVVAGNYTYFTGPNSAIYYGFTRSPNGSYSTIAYPGAGAGGTYATGINDNDVVVGYFYDSNVHAHGWVLNGSTFTRVDVPGATSTYVNGLNISGQLVGTFTDGNGYHAFIATPTAGSRAATALQPSNATAAPLPALFPPSSSVVKSGAPRTASRATRSWKGNFRIQAKPKSN
jgi:hypothetical protein